ncbi:hypothetical protein EON65_53550, partial [archaeon]
MVDGPHRKSHIAFSSSISLHTKKHRLVLSMACSLNYEHMYTSETFEDMPDIAPSLLASIRRNDEQDSKIRLNVYYQSNLTSGKEVLLTTTSFGERELLRTVQAAGEFASQMSAEYCAGSKAYV